MAKTIDKIMKKVGKKVNKQERSDILREINLVSEITYNELENSGYNPHKVRGCWAIDAKRLNKAYHQSGRGDYRYMRRNDSISGLAIHKSNGDYRIIVGGY